MDSPTQWRGPHCRLRGELTDLKSEASRSFHGLIGERFIESDLSALITCITRSDATEQHINLRPIWASKQRQPRIAKVVNMTITDPGAVAEMKSPTSIGCRSSLDARYPRHAAILSARVHSFEQSSVSSARAVQARNRDSVLQPASG